MNKGKLLATCAVTIGLFAAASAQAQVSVYDNTENFEGATASNGGVTAASGTRYTYLVADDLTYSPLAAGLTVSQFTFSVGNTNTASEPIKPEVRFFNSDGANGGPGTLLEGYNFNAVTIPAGEVEGFNYAPAAGTSFQLRSTGTIWAGITFANSGSSESAAIINNFGQGLFNPPLIGSSADQVFVSSATGTFAASNPAGTVATSPYAGYVANFEWQLQVLTLPVPEPSTMALSAIGFIVCAVAVARRRRVAA